MCCLIIVTVVSLLILDAACTNQTTLCAPNYGGPNLGGPLADTWNYIAFGLSGILSISMFIVYIDVVCNTPTSEELKFTRVDIV
jgi:hypothetical protein